MYISYRTRYATSMHQSFPRPRPPLEDTRSRLLLGDTRGKPTVFTLFLFDLGFPLVGKYTFFHGLAVQCGGLSVSLFRLFPVSHFPAFYEQFKFWRRSSDLKKGVVASYAGQAEVYNISTGQHQSSPGLLGKTTNIQNIYCFKIINGSYMV